MVQTFPTSTQPPVWSRMGSMFILLIMVTVLLPQAAGSQQSRIQPDVLQLAANEPGARLAVIVQMQHDTAYVATTIVRLGGVVTRDLSIIHAVAATLPTRAVLALAQIAGVRWISLDAPVHSTGMPPCTACVDTSTVQTTFIPSINADQVWNTAPHYQGQGVGVAVVDSGITPGADFTTNGVSRIVANVGIPSASATTDDLWGHGTHVAGIIAGNGAHSHGAYMGVAPQANLINVKVGDDLGNVRESDIVSGLQWINDNKTAYNIRVVNLSVNAAVAQSYNTSPLDAAVEILWFNKIVVVVAAGNFGRNALYPPANDPFVISVGAADDMGTQKQIDDRIASFSAYGKTQDGFFKPELVAPGVNIISTMHKTDAIAIQHPANVISADYFSMSGTSMAAPVVSGVVALLLQAEPNLTPDQVKYRLMATARTIGGYGKGAGEVNAYAAVNKKTTESANTKTQASQLLWTGRQPLTWDSTSWNSANWGAANWGAANWGAANWGSDWWEN